MRISDWSSDVCSSDLSATASTRKRTTGTMNAARHDVRERCVDSVASDVSLIIPSPAMVEEEVLDERRSCADQDNEAETPEDAHPPHHQPAANTNTVVNHRSEEHRGGKEWASTYRYRWSP